jgi:hypothetical protein
MAINGDAAAATRAQNHREHQSSSGGSSIRRLGDSKAIRVIRAAYWPLESFAQIPLKGHSVQPDRIRILHQSSRPNDSPGNSHTNRRRLAIAANAANPPLQIIYHVDDGLYGRRIIVLRRRYPETRQLPPRFIQRMPFDLRAAKVNSNTNPFRHILQSFIVIPQRSGGICFCLELSPSTNNG